MRFFQFALLTLLTAEIAVAGPGTCDLGQQTVDYWGDPIRIFVSTDGWTELTFEQPIVGSLPMPVEGIKRRRARTFKNRIFLQAEDDLYVGNLTVHDKTGTSYLFRVVSRPDCPTLSLRVHDKSTALEQDSPYQKTSNGPGSSPARSPVELLNVLMRQDQPPRGYQRIVPTGSRTDRMVFKQGPVRMFVEEIWKGRHLTGTILMVENTGRTPYHVAIEALDYRSRELREAFGHVKRVSMLPADRRLGPAAEYAVDVYHPQNKGMIFIVSERVPNGR